MIPTLVWHGWHPQTPRSASASNFGHPLSLFIFYKNTKHMCLCFNSGVYKLACASLCICTLVRTHCFRYVANTSTSARKPKLLWPNLWPRRIFKWQPTKTTRAPKGWVQSDDSTHTQTNVVNRRHLFALHTRLRHIGESAFSECGFI